MIIIDGLEMPKENERLDIVIHPDGKVCYCLDLECKQIANATPTKHGRNIANGNFSRGYENTSARIFLCSECGYGFDDIYLCNERDYPIEPNYCPNCGARMMNEVEE